MTPAAKAKELYDKFYLMQDDITDSDDNAWIDGKLAKKCSLIVVEEILNDYKIFNEKHKSYKVPAFWQEVRKEIELL